MKRKRKYKLPSTSTINITCGFRSCLRLRRGFRFVLQEIFSYFECEHYTCRVKFCTRRARDIHEMCHDEVRDMQFFCFQCGYRLVYKGGSGNPCHHLTGRYIFASRSWGGGGGEVLMGKEKEGKASGHVLSECTQRFS